MHVEGQRQQKRSRREEEVHVSGFNRSLVVVVATRCDVDARCFLCDRASKRASGDDDAYSRERHVGFVIQATEAATTTRTRAHMATRAADDSGEGEIASDDEATSTSGDGDGDESACRREPAAQILDRRCGRVEASGHRQFQATTSGGTCGGGVAASGWAVANERAKA